MGTFKVNGDIKASGTISATTFSGSLSGNASTATKLKTARTISLTGSVTGSGSFDGSGNLSITTTTNHIHSYIEPKGIYTFTSSTLPNSFDFGISAGFVNSDSGFGSFGSVLTIRTYSGGGGTLQLYAPYSPTYGGTHLKARFGNYDSNNGNSWTSLKDIAWVSDIPTKTSQLTQDSGFAYQGSHNNLTASGNEFTFASSAFSGDMYINYRTASGSLDGNITRYKFQNGKGSNTAIECSYMYGTAQAADYATSAGNADTVDGHHFHWSGQSGQPSWLWGGNDSTNMYVYNPSNFSVNYANSAGQADSVYGRYTGSGGNQIPSYIGSNTTKFNMMRNFGSSDIGGYMDCILMNNYSWSDVPYATGLGITKVNGYPRAMIANGPKTGWAYTAELLTSYNYSWWAVPVSGGTMTGRLKIQTNGITLDIGAQNQSWVHIYNGAVPFIFDQPVWTIGCFGIYQCNSKGCGSSFPSNPSLGQIFYKI